MKNTFLFLVILLSCSTLFAKKVKFAVNMTGQVVDSAGVHISGDFQDEAGYPADWDAAATEMFQESLDTNIYSVIVDIPAFRKYEYKFVNGDQFYQVEFVPIESRVGYFFNDDRWLWVDSLADDTTFVGAIIFSANAPAGLTLLRTVVDMKNETAIATEGVHVAGDFQGWDTQKNMLYSFGNDIYEIISYMPAAFYNFKYYNGNTVASTETVPTACALAGNRTVELIKDTILTTVCFSGCSACVTTSLNPSFAMERAYLSPNPSTAHTTLYFQDHQATHVVRLVDANGKNVCTYKDVEGDALFIEQENLAKGLYFFIIENEGYAPTVVKWILK